MTNRVLIHFHEEFRDFQRRFVHRIHRPARFFHAGNGCLKSLVIEKGPWLYPFVFVFLVGAAKFGVRALNSAMPERFQPTREELELKHTEMFEDSATGIREVLKKEVNKK